MTGEAARIVAGWIDGYNARDAAAQAALYAEDAVNLQYALGDPMTGRDAIRASLEAFYTAFPDSRIETEALVEDGERVALFWKARGSWRGPFAGREPNGNSFALNGSTLFVVREGHIVEQHAYWDRASLFAQLGITS